MLSFYFTIILDRLPYMELKNGFEVCGILSDFYMSTKEMLDGNFLVLFVYVM